MHETYALSLGFHEDTEAVALSLERLSQRQLCSV